MSTTPSTVLPPNDSYAVTVTSALWTEIAIAIVFVCLRVWARSYKRSLCWDDAFMATSWLLFLSDGIAFEFIAQAGGTRHWVYLSLDQQEYVSKVWVIIMILGIACTCFGKMAVGITILRIIGNTSAWQKWSIVSTVSLVIVSSIVDILFTAFRCGNPQALWDFSLAASAHCLAEQSTVDFNNFAAACQVFADFFFSLLPMAVVWGLHMPLRRKFYLIAALGLTLLTGGAGTAKTIETARLDQGDESWGMYPIFIWFGTEAMLITVCGSIPVLNPLWERLPKRFLQNSKGTGSRSSNTRYAEAMGAQLSSKPYPSGIRSQKDRTLAAQYHPTMIDSDVFVDVELARLTGYSTEAVVSSSAVSQSRGA